MRKPILWYDRRAALPDPRRRRRRGDRRARCAGRDIRGPLHVAATEAISRADLAQATAGWMRLPDGAVRTAPGVAPGRPGRIVLDSSLAASTLGIHCRPLAAALR